MCVLCSLVYRQVRPFGVSILIAGWNEGRPYLFQCDPSVSSIIIIIIYLFICYSAIYRAILCYLGSILSLESNCPRKELSQRENFLREEVLRVDTRYRYLEDIFLYYTKPT